MVSFLPAALHFLLTTFLWRSDISDDGEATQLRFQLRHQHAVWNSSTIVFADIPSSFMQESYHLNTRRLQTHRPKSFSELSAARERSMRREQSPESLWHDESVLGPDVSKRETLLQLAKMNYNVYYPSGDKEWYDLGQYWNNTFPFGWEPNADGFRGHVFVSEDNSTVIISVKGTSLTWMAGGGGPTVRKDKLNDNLLFSCCCGRVGPTWSPVCDCHSGGYTCDQTCVEKSLIDESLFYPIGTNLYNNVSYMYPNANIWVTGHSLGGALASLVGVTFGAPVVAFEAPGEKMAAARLHLPSPPSTQHITHVYHTADPIPMGACTGIWSSCALGGYALESHCHLGKVALYDTVTELGWSVDVRTHPIKVIVEKLLAEDWGEGREVPPAEEQKDCVDCFQWQFGDYKNTSLTVHG